MSCTPSIAHLAYCNVPAAKILRVVVVLAVCALGALAAIALLSPASGSPATATSTAMRPLESMFQDDRYLIDSPPATVARTLVALRALGVDRLRITVLWSDIAPSPGSPRKPRGFDAADPGAYPERAWAPYDHVLMLARAHGLKVDFDLTAPGPLWAMGGRPPLPRLANHYEPSAAAFRDFALAVGRRYSGEYVPAGARSALARVSFWSIWNEPNQPGWLAPQRLTRTVGGQATIESARLDRGYIDAGVAGLDRSGHRGDTILIGELAPEGSESAGGEAPVPPIPFLDALYCVARDQRPLTGAGARAQGCPVDASPSAFVSAHPGLFAATGFAHHPYSFFLAPQTTMSDPNFVPLADLSRLERTLDAIFRTYSVPRQLPLYLTEYGYETNPPNPFRGVSPATQASYLDEAAYMAWRDPRVRTLSQFLLVDSAPNAAYPRGSVRYWSTFQTGLVYLHGAPKPSFYTYRLPIFIPDGSFAPGETVGVWGMVRAAQNATAVRARIQWHPGTGGAGGWRTLATVTTRNPTGVFHARVSAPGSGWLRLAWTPSAGGSPFYSRTVAVQEVDG
jgi:hypothetical protein